MISSVTSHHYEFHNPDFKQHFKKRPFDRNVEETAGETRNVYKNKRIKTTSVNSLLSQQTTKPTKGTNYSSLFGLSKNIVDLRDDENDEENPFLDIPRIIDLSTGECLESISSKELLQKCRKPKRPMELVENQDESLSIPGTIEESNDDFIDDHSHKRIRISREYARNFIEEREEEIDPIVCGPVVDMVNGPKIGPFDKNVNLREPQLSQSLSLYGENSSNIKFTVPYQKAMARYMRSQFQHLNNDEFGNGVKQLILYHPKNKNYFRDSFVENNNNLEEENNSYKISEILEKMNVEGQNGVVSCINDSYEDQMDLD